MFLVIITHMHRCTLNLLRYWCACITSDSRSRFSFFKISRYCCRPSLVRVWSSVLQLSWKDLSMGILQTGRIVYHGFKNTYTEIYEKRRNSTTGLSSKHVATQTGSSLKARKYTTIQEKKGKHQNIIIPCIVVFWKQASHSCSFQAWQETQVGPPKEKTPKQKLSNAVNVVQRGEENTDLH